MYEESSASNQHNNEQECWRNEKQGRGIGENTWRVDVRWCECSVVLLNEISWQSGVGIITPVLIYLVCMRRQWEEENAIEFSR